MEGTKPLPRRIIIYSAAALAPFMIIAVSGIAVTILQSLGFMISESFSDYGFDAYKNLLQSGWFYSSFLYSIYIAAASSVLSVILGMAGAYFLWKLPYSFYRAALVYKIPIILPHITVGLLFLITFGSSVWELIHAPGSPVLVTAYVYKSVPFVMLMVYSVLRRFDLKQVYTAKMLGAGEAMIFRRLILPVVFPVLCTTFIILFLYSFGAFELPFLLGKSNPSMLAIDVYGRYFYRALSARPQAMASLVLMLIFSLIFTFMYFLVSGRKKINRKELL